MKKLLAVLVLFAACATPAEKEAQREGQALKDSVAARIQDPVTRQDSLLRVAYGLGRRRALTAGWTAGWTTGLATGMGVSK